MKKTILALALTAAASTARAGLPEGWGQQVEQDVQAAAAKVEKSCKSCAASQPRWIKTDGALLIQAFNNGLVPTDLTRYCGRWREVESASVPAAQSTGAGWYSATEFPVLQVAESAKFGGAALIYFQYGEETPSQLATNGLVSFNNYYAIYQWTCRLSDEDLVCRRFYVYSQVYEYAGFKREPRQPLGP